MPDQTEGFSPLPPGAPLDAQVELTLQDAILDRASAPVVSAALPPLGRAPQFDLDAHLLLPSAAGGPLVTRGQATLRGWVAKCIATRRGEHRAVDPGFGCDILAEDVLAEGSPYDPSLLAEWFSAIRRGLMVNPWITDVTDFETSSDLDSDLVEASFSVIPEGDDLDDFTFNIPIGAGTDG